MIRLIPSAAALALLAGCATGQEAETASQATAAESRIVTETDRWETEGSRDTLVRLKGPVGGWTSSRR